MRGVNSAAQTTRAEDRQVDYHEQHDWKNSNCARN